MEPRRGETGWGQQGSLADRVGNHGGLDRSIALGVVESGPIPGVLEVRLAHFADGQSWGVRRERRDLLGVVERTECHFQSGKGCGNSVEAKRRGLAWPRCCRKAS